MRKKMVLVGAGSAMFTQGLVMDLIREPGRNKWHLALVDIDAEVLASMTKLVRKMIEAKDADLELSSSTDRRDVLPGADYVESTIGVGGRRAWEQDVFIPRKYGVYQPVGDTAMPGGISRAMRMVPAVIAITRDIMELCPNAHFFNYSNPMTVLCRAVRKATGFPMTGLCIGVYGSQCYIARFAGLDSEKVTSKAVGVNHMTFIYDFRYEGVDAWPIVIKKLDETYKEDFDENALDRFYTKDNDGTFYLGEPFAWSLFKTYHAYPAPGDRHISEFFTERFLGGKYYGKTLGMNAYSFERTIELGEKIHAGAMSVANSDGPLSDDFFGHIHGEHSQLMEMIHSIETDGRKVFSVNLPNNGAVPNLPKDAVLELPACAMAKGFSPLVTTDFPDVLAGIVCKSLAISEVTVEAALKGDAKLFAEAIMMGGYISDRAAVLKMVDELIKAQSMYLPQFK
jgi:alpha-galactosidase